MAFKHYLRELLGLTIVVSVVFGVLSILLDFVLLYSCAKTSREYCPYFFPWIVLLYRIPDPALFAKVINRPAGLVSATEEYQVSKFELERP